jgi:hypothetical protein
LLNDTITQEPLTAVVHASRYDSDPERYVIPQFWHSKGYPSVKATASYDTQRQLLVIRCEQTQADAAKGVHLFDLPIEVRVR